MMLSICHRVVFNAAIHREWQRHESGFAKLWRVQMVSRRKEVRASEEEDEDLDNAILAGAPNNKTVRQLGKDVHLVLAALQTDRVIVTLDNEARKGFGSLSGTFRALKRLKWFDPSREYDEIQAWLRAASDLSLTINALEILDARRRARPRHRA